MKTPKWAAWVAVVVVALLWIMVFASTGSLWWRAEDPYPVRISPPEPLFTPGPTFDGVDPKVQHIPDEMARLLEAEQQRPEPGHRRAP